MPLQVYNPDEVPTRPLITLDPLKVHSDEFVGSQAAKMSLTLGEDTPGEEKLASSIQMGDDTRYKEVMAQKDLIRQQDSRNDVLSSIFDTDPSALTPEMIDVVQGLSTQELKSKDLGDIVEKKYAQLYTNTAASAIPNDTLENAAKADLEGTHEALDLTELLSYKRNYLSSILDTAQKEIEDQTWLNTAWNLAENMTVGEYQQRNAVGTDSGNVSAILPGTNKVEQYDYLMRIQDQDEFKKQVDAAYEDLKSRNPYTAQQWLEGFFNYSGSDAILDNLFALSDAATLVPIKTLKTALKSAVKVAELSPRRLPELAEAVGRVSDGAMGRVVEDVAKSDLWKQNIRKMDELEQSVPSISSPLTLMKGSDNLSQAASNRIRIALADRADLVEKFLTNPNLVERATPEELVQYKDVLLDDFVRKNPSIKNNVMDVKVATPDVGNVYTASVKIGKRDGTLFESEKQAENYFKRYIGGTNDYKIEQVGGGYRISIDKTVDETSFKDFRLGTTQQTPESLANTFLGNLRSPDYLVSRENDLQRSVTSSTRESLNKLYSEMTEPFRNIDKKSLDELQDLMVTNREKQEFYKDYGELEVAFRQKYGRGPTEQQVDAYFTYVQLNDLDLIVRDLDWYKQKARMGVEDVTFNVGSSKIQAEGRVVKEIPFGDSDYFSYTIIKNGEPSKPKSSHFAGDKDRLEVKRLQDEGYVIVQTSNGTDLGKGYTNFVVTKDVKRDRIGVKNVDRKPGGHKVYKYPYYVKQGNLEFVDEFASLYKGDTTLWNVKSMRDGKDVVDALEKARKMAKDGDPDLMRFIRDNLPMITPQKWAKAVKDGTINLDVPFTAVKSGQRTIDTGVYSNLRNLRDMTKNKHNLDNSIVGKFGGERSEVGLDIIKSEGDLKFEIEGAPYLSPMETLRMASSNMLSTRVMSDHTISTLQNFQREFGDILGMTKEEVAASGTSILRDPVFKEGADPSRVAAAQNVARAWRQLQNMPTALDTKINATIEKLVDVIEPKFGPRGERWADRTRLEGLPDPGAKLRSMAFDFKLGMFNPVSLFTQLNSAVNVVSLGGLRGLQGSASFPLIRWALQVSKPETMKLIAKTAESVGLSKADDFLESMAALKRSGWNDFAGDIAYLDDIRSPELTESVFTKYKGKMLSYGRTPFNEGERTVRLMAWQAAYLERKAALKGAKLTTRDEAIILKRAKDMTGNMTRESNATWQKGWPAVMTQFFGYQARITEQFLGKKLSGMEKARLFLGYSVVYGLPVASASTVGIFPVREMLREYLSSQGIDYEGTMAEPFIDGFASSMLKYMTGWEPNVASRYGPGGLPTLWDLWNEDKNISDLLLGASGGIALETVTSAWPALTGMMSEFSDFPGGYHNVTSDDWLKVLRNISTVDSAAKLYQVYNFGIWASKNGTSITEMDLPEGVLAVLTGLQPAEIEDSFTKSKTSRSWAEDKKTHMSYAQREYRKLQQMEDGPEKSTLLRQLKTELMSHGLTPRDIRTAWKWALDTSPMDNSVRDRYDQQAKERGLR